MAVKVCPKCKATVQQGSWEVVTHCPHCNLSWNVPDDAPERMLGKVRRQSVIFSALSVLPGVGLIFGGMGIFWGYLAVRRRFVTLGAASMFFSAIVGVIQLLVLYWAVGIFFDRSCLRSLAEISTAVQAYHDKHGAYAPCLKTLQEFNPNLRSECPVPAGGKAYIYIPPGMTWKEVQAAAKPPPASKPATATASTSASQSTSAASQRARSQPATSSSAPAAPVTRPAAVVTLLAEMPATAPAPTSSPASRPITSQASTSLASTGPAAAPDVTLLVTEKEEGHRQDRMCVMRDFTVRAIPYWRFDELIEQPQNAEFKKALVPAPPDRVLVEDPNMRIMGLSPWNFLWACVGAMTLLFIVGTLLVIMAVLRNKRKEEAQ